jgi:hypothetical protein
MSALLDYIRRAGGIFNVHEPRRRRWSWEREIIPSLPGAGKSLLSEPVFAHPMLSTALIDSTLPANMIGFWQAVCRTQSGPVPALIAMGFLLNGIYRRLPAKKRAPWIRKCKAALSKPRDLSFVWMHFARCILDDTRYGLVHYVPDSQQNLFREIASTCQLMVPTAVEWAVLELSCGSASGFWHRRNVGHEVIQALLASSAVCRMGSLVTHCQDLPSKYDLAQADFASQALLCFGKSRRSSLCEWQANTLLEMIKLAPVTTGGG